MTVTMKRHSAIVLILMISMMIFSAFMSPVEVHAAAKPSTTEDANDPNAVDVGIDENGNLTIKGGGFGDGKGTSATAWNDFIMKYRGFITGIAGIGAVTMIALFIVQFLKLGASAGNPQARSQALGGVLWTGIAAAGLGAVTIIVGFFYNAVR